MGRLEGRLLTDLAEPGLGQDRVDRAIRLEVTADETYVIDGQGGQPPYPPDFLIEALAQLKYALLGDPVLDTTDREMWGVRTVIGLKAATLVQILPQFVLEANEDFGFAGHGYPNDSRSTDVGKAAQVPEVQRKGRARGGHGTYSASHGFQLSDRDVTEEVKRQVDIQRVGPANGLWWEGLFE